MNLIRLQYNKYVNMDNVITIDIDPVQSSVKIIARDNVVITASDIDSKEWHDLLKATQANANRATIAELLATINNNIARLVNVTNRSAYIK